MATRRFVDLHTHSTASDGALAPAELIRTADRCKLAAIALTDHDTVDGLAEARKTASGFPDLTLINGIEVSANPPSGTLHILGLGIEPDAPSIQQLAAFLRDARNDRNPQIIGKLNAMGMTLDMDDVIAEAKNAEDPRAVIGRMHIAKAMVTRGLAADTTEAFTRYLTRGAQAYVERQRQQPRPTIQAICDAGGLAVLAHPVQLRCDNSAQLERIVRDLKDSGLGAIEAYHSDHDAELTARYIKLARRLGLHITGGSDFHGGKVKPEVKLGRPRMPLAALDESVRDRLFRSTGSGN